MQWGGGWIDKTDICMAIPLIVVCGSYPSMHILQEGALCPVCACASLSLCKESDTPCFCVSVRTAQAPPEEHS